MPLPGKLMPRCNQYLGTGRIPQGHVLAIYERAVGPNGHSDERYGFNGLAHNTEIGWTTEQMDHGADFVEVVGVLYTVETFKFIDSMVVVDVNGKQVDNVSIQNATLPPGILVPALVLHIDLDGTKPC